MDVQNGVTKKNIFLSYSLVFINNSFFWYAPWLLFLLNYITLPQAAILQSIGMLTSAVAEIPTGVLADLIGKKKTLNIAFLLTGIGQTVMAFSTTYPSFIISYIVLNIGYSFYSGTMEAFTYDTLATNGKENDYKKIVARSSAFSNAGTAVSSIVGGFLYSIWLGLPFLATGIMKFIGFFVSLYIDEPKVDTDKFTIKNFVTQCKKGFSHLFSKKMAGFTVLLLTFSIFHVPAYEIIDDMTVIDYGYAAKAIGILYAVSTLIAIPSSLLYSKISKAIPPILIFYFGILVLGLHYVFTPWITVVPWTVLYLIRVMYSPLRTNAISEILNKNTDSKIRATTLSTYSMVRILPFMALAGFIGTSAEKYGIRNFNAVFYFIMLVATCPQILMLLCRKFELNRVTRAGA